MHVFYTINSLELPQITILIIDNDKTVRTTLKQIQLRMMACKLLRSLNSITMKYNWLLLI